ncbi:MAG: LiaF domain-containing protein [Cyclobacteriaceae bacterium]
MYNKSYFTLGVLAILITATSCEINIDRDRDGNNSSELDEHSRQISLSEDITSLKTKVEMGGGVLNISGTDKYALDSYFESEDLDDIEIDYDTDGSQGTIYINQDKDFNIKMGGDNTISDEWNIKLNRKIVQDMDITLGAGESELDLSDFNLRDVKITMGAGENDIDLRNSSPETLKVEAGVGDIRLDLSGKWKNDSHIRVSGGIGQLVLILPEDTDIEVEVNGGLGSVEASSLDKRGRKYYQEGRGYKLDIEVNAGIGSLEIITR